MRNFGDWSFKTSGGNPIKSIDLYVNHWLDDHPNGRIFIGSDSKKRGAKTNFSVSICLWAPNYGVHELHFTEKLKSYPDDFSRLWEEVERAVHTAQCLNGVKSSIQVHVDLNNNPKYFSSKLYEASLGFINSLGYQAVGKPNAWAASAGAHKYCQ